MLPAPFSMRLRAKFAAESAHRAEQEAEHAKQEQARKQAAAVKALQQER